MGSEANVAPFIIMAAGALILPFLPRLSRPYATLVVPLLALMAVWFAPVGINLTLKFMDYQLVLFKVDSLSRIFGTIFALITLIGSIFAFHVRETAEQTAALLYAAGAVGVTFAGDFLTLFFFWELMSLPSAYLVWASKTEESGRAGMRYLLFHLFGGALLLAGILMHTAETGRILIEQLPPGSSFSSWLILAGVALNAAVVPLHAWLPDAYPKATVTGAVFLSALTTKTAVYVLLRIFPGWEVLIFLGVFMALYGVVFAVLANDIRGLLSYHIISQVGYMVAGAGIGTQLAINGAAAHAFSHILYKSLLFMGAGSVIFTTGKSKMTELGGLAKKQPLVFWLYMIGAFSISGFPLFNGFISKSMVIAAAGEAHYTIVWLLLTLASVGTFLHTGLKLPYYTWFGEERGLTPTALHLNMYFAMAVAAFFCVLFGVMPDLLYDMLPFSVSFAPYTVTHLTETAQILIFTFVAFWIYRKKVAGEAGTALDVDWVYRKPAKLAEKIFTVNVEAVFNRADKLVNDFVRSLAVISRNPVSFFLGRVDSRDYSPDDYRPAVGALIVLTLLCFLLFVGWGWLV
ncbi:MAG: Na(+)/H(+) antiporter subunit D [Syntrophales bacterium]